MDIESTIGKFLNPIEKHGTLIGVGLQLIGDINPLLDSINIAMGGGLHAPEWRNILNATFNDPNNRMAIAAAVAGYFLKDATGNATFKKGMQVLQNVGLGYAVAYAFTSGFYFSTHSPAGSTMNQPSRADYRENYTGRPTAGSGHSQYAGAQLKGN
jgi:hypothetical protein